MYISALCLMFGLESGVQDVVADESKVALQSFLPPKAKLGSITELPGVRCARYTVADDFSAVRLWYQQKIFRNDSHRFTDRARNSSGDIDSVFDNSTKSNGQKRSVSIVVFNSCKADGASVNIVISRANDDMSTYLVISVFLPPQKQE